MRLSRVPCPCFSVGNLKTKSFSFLLWSSSQERKPSQSQHRFWNLSQLQTLFLSPYPVGSPLDRFYLYRLFRLPSLALLTFIIFFQTNRASCQLPHFSPKLSFIIITHVHGPSWNTGQICSSLSQAHGYPLPVKQPTPLHLAKAHSVTPHRKHSEI